MSTLSAKGIFITGSDTGVGKTRIACAIARKLTKEGVKVIPRKPVESGCKINDGQLIAEDAEKLKQAADYSKSVDVVCPYKFEPAIAPAQAAKAAGVSVSIRDLLASCQMADDGFLLVEGAGGWLSPIARNAYNADLAQELNLPVILVVAHRLGCINQTLLTLESIENRGLRVEKIYLNHKELELTANPADFEYLNNKLEIPVEAVGYNATEKIEFDLSKS